MSDIPSSESNQSPAPDQVAHLEQSIRGLYQVLLKRQSELIGELELQFHHCTAVAESAQKALIYERNILRLMTRYDVGLLDNAGQLELWRLAKDPARHRGLDPDMTGIFKLGDDENGNAESPQHTATPSGDETQGEPTPPKGNPS